MARAARLDWLAKAGYAARGIVYILFGWLALSARGNAQEGKNGVFDAIRDMPMGDVLLTLTALGLLAYGVYRLVCAFLDIEGKGTEPKGSGWYAGKQYDDDTANAKAALADIDRTYPGAKKYEVAGFVFWQGEKDGGSPVHSARYEKNLVQFIKQLRKDFDAPNAKFVVATLGEAKKGGGGNGGMVLDAHLAVDGKTGKHSEFTGNVATVYSNPLSNGGSGTGHYNGDAGTYVNVGEAMGKAMVDLLKSK